MSLSKKLIQQQLLKNRNEASLSSVPLKALDESASTLPLSKASEIQSSLENLRRRARGSQLDRDTLTVKLSDYDVFSESLDGNNSFFRRLSHSAFGLDDQQGAAKIRRLIQLLCRVEGAVDPRSVAFVDTETTGLSGGAGTVAFLVGVGRWTDSGFSVEQYMMRDYDQERAMLLELRESLANTQALVTFNGKAFDIPLLQSRFVLARQRWPLVRVVHLDLLHPARRIWKLRLANCSLANLERDVLGIERENDIPGHLIPYVYFRYIRTRSPRGIRSILSHNRQDIETLARLTLRMGEIFSGQFSEDLDPVDLFSAGKYAHALGERDLAILWNEAALQGGLPKSQEVEARKTQAARLKEQKRYSEAAELWRDLTERSESFLEDIEEELAIHHEHRTRDLEEALRVSERALAQLQDRTMLKKWEHRRARVARKLAERAQAEAALLFPSLSSND